MIIDIMKEKHPSSNKKKKSPKELFNISRNLLYTYPYDKVEVLSWHDLDVFPWAKKGGRNPRAGPFQFGHLNLQHT